MEKNQLKIELSKLTGFKNPKVKLEQYETPPGLAADIIHHMKMSGITETVDFGSGTGILAIGASLAGIDSIGLEIDGEALSIAEKNAKMAGVEVDFVEQDVAEFQGSCQSVVMNPPFNIQSDEGLTFWKKALESGDRVYGLAGKGFRPKLERLCDRYGHEIVGQEEYTIKLPNSYDFHVEEGRDTLVVLYATRRSS